MKERLPALDGLRGLAILMVTGFHLWRLLGQPQLPVGLTPFAPWGAMYVSLFFALSGFCLSLGKPQSAMDFYRSRLCRLLPAYWLTLLIWLPLWANAAHNARGWHGWQYDLLSHLTFTHTLFPSRAYSINGVLWFVGTLVHLYLLFPLLSRLMARRPGVTTVAALAVSTGWRWWAVANLPYTSGPEASSQQLALISAPAHLAEFVAGMYGARLLAARPQPLMAAVLALPVVVFGPYLHALTIPANQPMPYWWADSLLAPCWVGLILAAAWGRWASYWPLPYLGRVSFGVFLHNYAMYWVPLWLLPGVLLCAGHATAWLTSYSRSLGMRNRSAHRSV